MRRMIVSALVISSALIVGATEPAPIVIEPGSDLYPAGVPIIDVDVPTTLSIDPTGAVRCTAGSGALNLLLRRTSCELIVRRNVFGPDVKSGALVAATYRFIVRWKKDAENRQFGGAIPVGRDRWITYADYPPIARYQIQTGRVALKFEISNRGLVENCKITRTNTSETLAGVMCPLLASRAVFLPAVDQVGNSQRTSGSFTADWRWCDRPGSCGSPDVR